MLNVKVICGDFDAAIHDLKPGAIVTWHDPNGGRTINNNLANLPGNYDIPLRDVGVNVGEYSDGRYHIKLAMPALKNLSRTGRVRCWAAAQNILLDLYQKASSTPGCESILITYPGNVLVGGNLKFFMKAVTELSVASGVATVVAVDKYCSEHSPIEVDFYA